jgi:hypothetical protein
LHGYQRSRRLCAMRIVQLWLRASVVEFLVVAAGGQRVLAQGGQVLC